jgi:hypothetical protein
MIYILKLRSQHLLVWNNAPPQLGNLPIVGDFSLYTYVRAYTTHITYIDFASHWNQIKSCLYTCIFHMCYCLTGLDKHLLQVNYLLLASHLHYFS